VTPRQSKILVAIIREFMQSAESVGSLSIARKYELGVSPATIRNEMARLSDEGFIQKQHLSAGRLPTSLGIRFYINDLLELAELSNIQELEMERRIFENRFATDRLIKHAISVVSELTRNACVGIVDDTLFFSGISDLMSYEELQDVGELRSVVTILENKNLMSGILEKAVGRKDGQPAIIVGSESGLAALEKYSIVFNDFNLHGGKKGYLAVVGPMRMDYGQVVPIVRFVSNKISNLTQGW